MRRAPRREGERSHCAGAGAAFIAAFAGPRQLTAQKNPCTVRHPMVDAVTFTGTKRVRQGDVASMVTTERTGLFRRVFGLSWGPLTCLDSAEVE